jgi:hypothetical protein
MRHRALRVTLSAAIAAAGFITISEGSPASAATWSIVDLNTPGVNATRLAQEIAGQGVTIMSATFSGDNRQGGLFSGPGVVDAIGVSDGVVMSSGIVGEVVGPNNADNNGESFGGGGDAGLDALVTPYDTHDAAVLEMTFVPTNPDLQINYVFASEEYREWVDSQFNDVFAFWVNGVALANNCATVADPGGRVPVTINTINHLRNTQIYVDNPEPGTYDTQFDGFTLPLTCFATVAPNVPNTLKIAVADTSDSILDSAVFLESSGVTSTPKTKYSPLAPQRVLDTRPSGIKVPAGGTINVPIAGKFGVPTDAVSVALNVTATQAEDNGFLTVYPNGQALPVASNVNYTTGADVPNLVVAPLGTDGSINIFSEDATHVIVDIFGWFGTNATNGFVAAVPTRVFDSRNSAKVGAGQVVTFPVVGFGGVPAGTPSVALNLTIDQPDQAGFASAFASGAPVPLTSNVNFAAGQTRPNVVFAPVGADGQVSVFVSTGAHVIADVFGWYSTASDAELFKPVKPKRVWDSRQHTIIPAGGELTLKVTDIVGVPSTATAVVLNVTVTAPVGSGFLTVYAANVARPDTSNVNYVASQTVPNVVITGVSVDGRIKIWTFADAHIIVDVAGWFG